MSSARPTMLDRRAESRICLTFQHHVVASNVFPIPATYSRPRSTQRLLEKFEISLFFRASVYLNIEEKKIEYVSYPVSQ